MTDNRTTELTATERICEQLEAAGVSFVRSEQIVEGTYWGVTWLVGETKFEFRENNKRTDLIAFNATPEQAIAATLGSDAKPCYAADENYKRCKYSVNRGWCDDAPFLVWDDTGHLFITMGGLKTWDVTDDAKKWFAELGSVTCEVDGTNFWEWEWSDYTAYYEHEPSCGHVVTTMEPKPPKFCEECGAKVVER